MSFVRRMLSPPVLIAAAAATLTASVGGALTDIGFWYDGLAKPSWQPPDYAFPIAWTTIFALCAGAGAIGWFGLAGADRGKLIGLFALNAVLNVGWSVLFFRLKRPDWSLAEVALLWASIGHLILFLRPRVSLAAWLLVPYLLWVSFAALLNYEIVRLNAPFGGGG